MGFTVSCGSVQKTEDGIEVSHPTTVEVRNFKPIDFNLYVITGTHRLCLGDIPGLTTRTFVIPSHVLHNKVSRMRFGLDTIGTFELNTMGTLRSASQPLPGGFPIRILERFLSTEVPAVRVGDQLSLTIQDLERLFPIIRQPIDPTSGEAVVGARPVDTSAATSAFPSYAR
jgi:hypothetical protein